MFQMLPCTPRRNRTRDLDVRSVSLCPTELEGHVWRISGSPRANNVKERYFAAAFAASACLALLSEWRFSFVA